MEDNLSKLKEIALFAGLNEQVIAVLSNLLKEERYTQGEHILREGDPANSAYIIQSGEVETRKVIIRDMDKYKTLSILDKGNIFGEMALFGEKTRSADVVVREDSVVWRLDYSELSKIIDNSPATGIKILQVIITLLVSRIKSMNNELAALYELGTLLPRLNTIEELTGTVFEISKNSVKPAEDGFLAILNIFNEEFDIYQSSKTLDISHISINDPVSSWMLENRSSLIVKVTDADGRFKDTPYSGRSFIATPFVHENSLLGFMLFSNPSEENAFNNSHMILLSAVCNQAAFRINDIDKKKEETLKQRLNEGKLTA
jgi:CRP-like cAMP-binding protein